MEEKKPNCQIKVGQLQELVIVGIVKNDSIIGLVPDVGQDGMMRHNARVSGVSHVRWSDWLYVLLIFLGGSHENQNY